MSRKKIKNYTFMYTKKNSAEIELNIMFRDFLIANEQTRKQYENRKIIARKMSAANDKTPTGISKYNLIKEPVIKQILKQARFEGKYVRFFSI